MYVYKCPNENQCKIKKHCHILETVHKLPEPLDIVHKCPAEKGKIKIKVIPDSFKTS